MKFYFALYWLLDQKLWKGKMNVNMYYTTLGLMVLALLSVASSGGAVLNSWFSWDTALPAGAVVFAAIVLWLCFVYESIVAAEHWKYAVQRSLVTLLSEVVVIVVACVASLLVLGVLALIFFVYLIKFMFTVLLGGPDDNKKRIHLENGTVLKESKGILGEKYYEDADTGESYKRSDTNSDEFYKE